MTMEMMVVGRRQRNEVLTHRKNLDFDRKLTITGDMNIIR